jgi:adenylyl-sulfate kinase
MRMKRSETLGEHAERASSTRRFGGASAPGFIVWLTGLSGSGKSTLAEALRQRIGAVIGVEILDGDEMRRLVCSDLSFSRADRDTNVRRIGFVARLLARHGVAVIVASISPYESTRAEVRRLVSDDGIPFIEAFVSAPLETLIDRDVKGLYKKALAGEIGHFTGVSDPYEPPANPDVVVRTAHVSVGQATAEILSLLTRRQLIPADLDSPVDPATGAAPVDQPATVVGSAPDQVLSRGV